MEIIAGGNLCWKKGKEKQFEHYLWR